MREFTAVVDPAAGGSLGAAALVPLARLLRESGADVEVVYSHGLEHAGRLAAEAAARGRVVLGVGGTAGQVGGALAGSGAPLGIVPAGRGDDFARALGLPRDPADLARVLLHGRPRPVDAIEVSSSRHERATVLGSVYAGVDAVANRHADASRRLSGRASSYGALRAVAGWRATGCRVTVDGRVRERGGCTVVVANSPFHRFGRRIAPDAEVDDGLLDVVLVRDVPRPLFFTVMRELRDGRHLRRTEAEVLRGREVRIEADRPLPYAADGAVEGALPVAARVLPGALAVLR